MTRCLVLIRSHEPLQEGWRKRSFGPAGRLVEERVKVGGVRFDETYHPVRVLRRIGGGNDPPVASFRYGGVGPGDNYALRADFADQDAIARLRRDRGAEIVGVFAAPAVSPFPSAYCGAAPIGATRDVARRLGVPALRRAGLTGAGVSVAVVDTGIDGSRIPVAGGWAPTPGYVPGSSAPDHGTMVAYDVRIAAPDARILDYALLKSQAGTWAAFLSDGIAAFADLVERVNAAPGRWVVNNSWGLFDRASDAPVGSPENYSANPDHPFNQITRALLAAGARLLFPAGRRSRGRAAPAIRHGPAGAGAAQGPAAADRSRSGGRRLGLRPGLRGDRCRGGGQGAGCQAAREETPESEGLARRQEVGSWIASAKKRTPGIRSARSRASGEATPRTT